MPQYAEDYEKLFGTTIAGAVARFNEVHGIARTNGEILFWPSSPSNNTFGEGDPGDTCTLHSLCSLSLSLSLFLSFSSLSSLSSLKSFLLFRSSRDVTSFVCFNIEDLRCDSNDAARGDCHYWGVWHGKKPFSEYRKVRPRFCSEFGFQSFPAADELRPYLLNPDEDCNVNSPAMNFRQRSPAVGNIGILDHISREFRLPSSFEAMCYVSQVLQAMSIRTAVEQWRRSVVH